MKCRVAVFLIIGWGVLSLIGYLKKDGIYKNYSIDVKKTPYFVLVLDGIHDKIYPWSKELPDLLPDGTKPQNQESVIASTETTDEENVAEQTETVMQDTETAAAKPKKFIQVDDSYFDDAVFIGDSRTVGLHDYGGLDHSDFFATVGMNIYDLCFPDTDLATDHAVFLAGGNTVINFWIVHEPADLALCGFMTDRTSGACHFSVFHDFFSYSKLSGNIFIVIRIGNVNLIFFLLWILIYIQRRVIDDDHIVQFLQNFRCIVCVCQCSVKSIFLLNL